MTDYLNGETRVVNGNFVKLSYRLNYNTHISRTLKASIEYKFSENDSWKTIVKYTNWYYQPLNEVFTLPEGNTDKVYIRNFLSEGWISNLNINAINIPYQETNEQYNYELNRTSPLTFEILEEGKLWLNHTMYDDGVIAYYKFYYSYDKINWNKFLYLDEDNALDVHIGEKIYIGGYTTNAGGSYLDEDYDESYRNLTLAGVSLQMRYCYFQTTCKFNVSGNILSLINKNSFLTIPGLNANLYGLFLNCNKLISAKDLILPTQIGSTHGTEFAFSFMFEGCSSLIDAPIIFNFENHTSIGIDGKPHDLMGMFLNCSNLNRIIFLKEITNDNLDIRMREFLDGVYPTGVLLKNPSVNASVFADIIPEGWVIQDYEGDI